MKWRLQLARFARAVVVAAVSTPAIAAAQSVAPTPASTPAAFTAKAHMSITVSMPQGPMTLTARVGLAQREQVTRVDFLSVQSPVLRIPIGTLTVVIDRSSNTLTAWNDSSRSYYTQPILPRPAASSIPSSAPSAKPSPLARAKPVRSALADLEVLVMTVRLLGHTTTVGIPTTGLGIDVEMRKKTETKSSHIVATLQIADDYAFFPVSVDMTFEPGVTPFGGKLSYAVDSFDKTTPPIATFDIPAGYREEASIFAVVLGAPAPRAPASALPSRTPSP
jgi:hypothetical protein